MSEAVKSIRASSWIGAQCIKAFCRKHKIEDQRLDIFVRYVEAALSAQEISRWNAYGRHLEISGQGDPLPANLDQHDGLAELIRSVREISASQLYRRWDPEIVSDHLDRSQRIAEVGSYAPEWIEIVSHDPENDGWGKPMIVSEWMRELEEYSHNPIVDELFFHLEHGVVVNRIKKVSTEPQAGAVFSLLRAEDSFLDISINNLDQFWVESKNITSQFPQLSDLHIVD